ncbi:MAG: hypothetical protein V3W34_10415 [Phycisphaerae bacterium]
MMRSVLSFLKTHLFNIICGLVVLSSVGVGVLGMAKMSDVSDQLKGVKSLHGKFSRFTKEAANDETIAVERQRVETVRRYYQELLQQAYAFNRYAALRPPEGEAFFPEATRNGMLSFREIYLAEFDKMLKRLKAGMPPTPSDVSKMQEIMREEQRAATAFGVDQPTEPSQRGGPQDTAPPEEDYKSGLITTAAARESATARAAIVRAWEIRCYADYSQAFDIKAVATYPRPEDMWAGQLSLWVQQDVVESLARINDTAAQALNVDPWVGVLPVKELISIRVSDYLLPSADTRPRSRSVTGFDAADPPSTSESVFTKNTTTALYELVRFSLKMVVDPRDLPLIINEICKNKFHTVLNLAYAHDPEDLLSLDMSGKIYGEDPVVTVLIDFETIFFGDIYRRIMPDEVLGGIGKTRPTDDEES